MDVQPLIDRFLENPDALTEVELAALVEALQASTEQTTVLREQLFVAELLEYHRLRGPALEAPERVRERRQLSFFARHAVCAGDGCAGVDVVDVTVIEVPKLV